MVNMNVCRICLMTTPNKDISKLRIGENKREDAYVDILKFCLDIKVVQDGEVSTKLCLKCYRKVIAFYNFKTLALQSDSYLKSMHADSAVKDEACVDDVSDIKEEHQSMCSDEDSNLKIEFIKEEEVSQDSQSEDELLSVIKKIKYEFIEDTNETAPVKKKKGRPKKVKLKRTRDTKENKPDQVCDECGMTVKNLKDHLNRHLPKENRKRIKCHACDKIFSSHSARYKHNKRKHLGIKELCKICNKFVTSLKQHTQVIHEADSLPFICVSCGKRFISQSKLDIHMTIHTKDRPYQCDQCVKNFRSKLSLLMHIRQVHDQEKTHVCEFCSKSFFKKYHLQIHLRTHTKEKPYKCPDCGKHFATTSILNNHRLIHGDDKRFACTLCDMTFVRRGYLNAHMISHTKVKRHSCKYCGLKFGRSDHRKRHEFTAHEKHVSTDPASNMIFTSMQ